MRQASLVLLIKENQILLAMKKRGFGKGRYNGVGGKPKENESVLDSAIREAEEEIGIKIENPEKFAIMDFHFPEELKEKDWDQQVRLYIAKNWEGEPIETEEMKPKWFEIKDIPYNQMWEDDKFWLPLILECKKLKCKFFFDNNDKIINKEIKIVDKLQ